MKKRVMLIVFVITGLALLFSCNTTKSKSTYLEEPVKADARMDEIVLAIKDRDKEALNALFSKKAIDEAANLNSEIDYLFVMLQGEVDSWERDGFASSTIIELDKKSTMLRIGFKIITNVDEYSFYVIDYNTDTINPDNEGIYMLELIKFTNEQDLDAWQDRMRPGIYIH